MDSNPIGCTKKALTQLSTLAHHIDTNIQQAVHEKSVFSCMWWMECAILKKNAGGKHDGGKKSW